MAASPLDLTTLALVRQWIYGAGTSPAPSTNADAELQGLVTAASRAVYAYLSRPSLLPRAFTERYDGQGNRAFYLRNYPVLSISYLANWGASIPAGAPPTNQQPVPVGFIVQPWDGCPPGQPQRVDTYGNYPYGSYGFGCGRENVSVTYMAGYAVQAEPWTVPMPVAPATVPVITPIQPYGSWGSDLGVTYATGVAFTKITGTPTLAGTYAVSAAGVYTFSTADESASILVSYGFVPADIQQVATELVGERFAYQSRIGQVSKTLGGQETVSFSQKAMSDAQKGMLQPYRQEYIQLG